MTSDLRIRTATLSDLPQLTAVMDLAIDRLQDAYLDRAQVAASRQIMGLDTQLVRDGTYFAVIDGAAIIGCGGWSFRATLFGGDHSEDQRDPARLDPRRDAARVRAMYTHPDHVRRGVGRLVLDACEAHARRAGFHTAELMATLSGEPLYRACGYAPIDAVEERVGAIAIPLIKMGKTL